MRGLFCVSATHLLKKYSTILNMTFDMVINMVFNTFIGSANTKQTRGSEMNVIEETIQSDASAWSAVVEIRGVVYRAGYVANRLSCSLGPYKHNPRRARWHIKAVTEWAEKQVAKFSPEWLAMHRELYAA